MYTEDDVLDYNTIKISDSAEVEIDFSEKIVADKHSLIVKSGNQKFNFYLETMMEDKLLKMADGETMDSGIDVIGILIH